METDTELQRIGNALGMRLKSLEELNNDWGSYIDYTKVLVSDIADLISQVPEEMQNLSVFPALYSHPSQPQGIHEILNSNPILEVLTEKEICLQRYNEMIHQQGLTDETSESRKQQIQKKIKDHNELCNILVRNFDEKIDSLMLSQDYKIPQLPPDGRARQTFDLIKSVEKGDLFRIQ